MESFSPADELVSFAKSLNSDLVSLWVSKFKTRDDHATIEQIWSEAERGKGHAGTVLRALIAKADELGVTLTLEAHWLAYDPDDDDDDYDRLWALNDHKLDNAQLAAWYERLGFVPTGHGSIDEGDLEMIRTPR